MKQIHTLSFLRKAALIFMLAGTLASLGLTLKAGRNNNSDFLIVLFITWVLSPYMVLMVAHLTSKNWGVPARLTLYILIMILTLVSLVMYSGVLSPPGTKPTFVFLIVPLISLLLIAIVIPLTRRLSGRNDRI